MYDAWIAYPGPVVRNPNNISGGVVLFNKSELAIRNVGRTLLIYPPDDDFFENGGLFANSDPLDRTYLPRKLSKCHIHLVSYPGVIFTS